MEIGSWTRCLNLLETAYKVCDSKDSLLYAHLLNTAAIIHGKRNHTTVSLTLYNESRLIRERLLPRSHEELANTYNNIGNVLLSQCEYEKAHEAYQKAIDIDMLKPEEERNKILHLRYLNVGGVYRFQNLFEKSREYIEIGRTFAVRHFGENTYYEAMYVLSLVLGAIITL
jgi:tetratricopeptide (TPR) repeat protein